MSEAIFSGARNRILQILARLMPGAMTLRVLLHRWRGVKVGKHVWIGYDAIIETSHPEWVVIGDGAWVGIRATIIAHSREAKFVTIENGATIGPGAIVLPGVTIGRDAVVTAGSVVTCSVPPMTVVQGNPAKPVARCGIALTRSASAKEFSKGLRPIK